MIKIGTEKLPILIWAEEEDLAGQDGAIEQAKNLANHPLARKHIALMPDFHVGYGMPIGGVMATSGGVIPNAVGVDIGCGMIALKTELEADALDRAALMAIRVAVHRRVPVGNAGHQKVQPLWEGARDAAGPVVASELQRAERQIGTLGGGNHFIELQRDEQGFVWLMVHSGSRGIGQKVCNAYDAIAKEEARRWHSSLPDEDLAFLATGTESHDAYLAEMRWCMAFAENNRERMLAMVCDALTEALGREVPFGEGVQTHHNYAELEHHMGEDLLVHRKGAVHASGLVTIPGSMGTASYIAEGKENILSFQTCSHGGGRVMGRKEANRRITHERAVESMQHVAFGVRQGDYEEMPDAYKDIDRVMENQRDLVAPVHRLVPLAVVKG